MKRTKTHKISIFPDNKKTFCNKSMYDVQIKAFEWDRVDCKLCLKKYPQEKLQSKG